MLPHYNYAYDGILFFLGMHVKQVCVWYLMRLVPLQELQFTGNLFQIIAVRKNTMPTSISTEELLLTLLGAGHGQMLALQSN